MIAAPAVHLAALHEQLCTAWSACRDSPEMSSGDATAAINAAVQGCETESMPPLRFHVASADGAEQVLELQPHDYVIEMNGCMLAFQALDWETEAHGAVWIFGSPFFYNWAIEYDASTNPPQVAFSTSGCDPCDAQAPSLLNRASTRRTLRVPP